MFTKTSPVAIRSHKSIVVDLAVQQWCKFHHAGSGDGTTYAVREVALELYSAGHTSVERLRAILLFQVPYQTAQAWRESPAT